MAVRNVTTNKRDKSPAVLGGRRIAAQTCAIPFDVPGVELTHEEPMCGCDAFLKKYKLEDAALRRLADIVRGADASRLNLTPQSAGLYAFSQGLSMNFADDHEMPRRGMVMYDALYPIGSAPNTRRWRRTHNLQPRTRKLPTDGRLKVDLLARKVRSLGNVKRYYGD